MTATRVLRGRSPRAWPSGEPGRGARSLRLDHDTEQLQAKATGIDNYLGESSRYLQVRYWTAETSDWTHPVIDPNLYGIASILAVGYEATDTDSWAMVGPPVVETYGVQL